nr:cytochrome c [Halopseudomonas bauzanensis]
MGKLMAVSVHCSRPLLLVAALLLAATTAAAPLPTTERQQQLANLLLQDCGSCHGLRMTGGLGPALTREALTDKPRDSLLATVTHGRPGTAMPGWKALLDEQDIAWLVDRLLEGAPQP